MRKGVRRHTHLRHSLQREGATISETTTYTGRDVMAWLDSDDAVAQARRLARRRRLDGYDAMPQNVLAEARLSVWHRLRSSEPMHVRTPGGYGTMVIRSVLRRLAEGRDGPVPLGLGSDAGDAAVDPNGDPAEWVTAEPPIELPSTAADDVRLVLEQADDGRAWVTSAALSYLVLLVDPGARPDGVPWPLAGATPEQARCWPGLWFAGERDLFGDPADARDAARIRRARARRIAVVFDRVQRALATYRMELEANRG